MSVHQPSDGGAPASAEVLPFVGEELIALRCQEDLLVYDRPFASDEALALGLAVAKLAPCYERGFSVAVVRDADDLVMFEWAATGQGPRNARFMDAKRAASRLAGCSGLRIWLEHEREGRWQELFDALERDSAAGAYLSVLPVEGSFPICERDEASTSRRVATLTVSGLHDGQDHEVMVRGLCDALGLIYGVDVPACE